MMGDQNYELFRSAPRSKTAQQQGGLLSSFLGDSYKGGNVWDTKLGKQFLPMMGPLTAQNPALGGGLLALGMGPKNWQTLMSPGGSGSGRIGGFSSSQYKPGTSLASYGTPQQPTPQQPVPQPALPRPTSPQQSPMTRAQVPTPNAAMSIPPYSVPRASTAQPMTQLDMVQAVTPRSGIFGRRTQMQGQSPRVRAIDIGRQQAATGQRRTPLRNIGQARQQNVFQNTTRRDLRPQQQAMRQMNRASRPGLFGRRKAGSVLEKYGFVISPAAVDPANFMLEQPSAPAEPKPLAYAQLPEDLPAERPIDVVSESPLSESSLVTPPPPPKKLTAEELERNKRTQEIQTNRYLNPNAVPGEGEGNYKALSDAYFRAIQLEPNKLQEALQAQRQRRRQEPPEYMTDPRERDLFQIGEELYGTLPDPEEREHYDMLRKIQPEYPPDAEWEKGYKQDSLTHESPEVQQWLQYENLVKNVQTGWTQEGWEELVTKARREHALRIARTDPKLSHLLHSPNSAEGIATLNWLAQTTTGEERQSGVGPDGKPTATTEDFVRSMFPADAEGMAFEWNVGRRYRSQYVDAEGRSLLLRDDKGEPILDDDGQPQPILDETTGEPRQGGWITPRGELVQDIPMSSRSDISPEDVGTLRGYDDEGKPIYWQAHDTRNPLGGEAPLSHDDLMQAYIDVYSEVLDPSRLTADQNWVPWGGPVRSGTGKEVQQTTMDADPLTPWVDIDSTMIPWGMSLYNDIREQGINPRNWREGTKSILDPSRGMPTAGEPYEGAIDTKKSYAGGTGKWVPFTDAEGNKSMIWQDLRSHPSNERAPNPGWEKIRERSVRFLAGQDVTNWMLQSQMTGGITGINPGNIGRKIFGPVVNYGVKAPLKEAAKLGLALTKDGWRVVNNVLYQSQIHSRGLGASNLPSVPPRVPLASHGPPGSAAWNTTDYADDAFSRVKNIPRAVQDAVRNASNVFRTSEGALSWGATGRSAINAVNVPKQVLSTAKNIANAKGFWGKTNALFMAAEGVKAILGEPALDAHTLSKAVTPEEIRNWAFSGSQGTFSKDYGNAAPVFGSKYLGQTLQGMSSPQAASRELVASGLDFIGMGLFKAGLIKDPRLGRKVSDPSKPGMRIGASEHIPYIPSLFDVPRWLHGWRRTVPDLYDPLSLPAGKKASWKNWKSYAPWEWFDKVDFGQTMPENITPKDATEWRTHFDKEVALVRSNIKGLDSMRGSDGKFIIDNAEVDDEMLREVLRIRMANDANIGVPYDQLSPEHREVFDQYVQIRHNQIMGDDVRRAAMQDMFNMPEMQEGRELFRTEMQSVVESQYKHFQNELGKLPQRAADKSDPTATMRYSHPMILRVRKAAETANTESSKLGKQIVAMRRHDLIQDGKWTGVMQNKINELQRQRGAALGRVAMANKISELYHDNMSFMPNWLARAYQPSGMSDAGSFAASNLITSRGDMREDMAQYGKVTSTAYQGQRDYNPRDRTITMEDISSATYARNLLLDDGGGTVGVGLLEEYKNSIYSGTIEDVRRETNNWGKQVGGTKYPEYKRAMTRQEAHDRGILGSEDTWPGINMFPDEIDEVIAVKEREWHRVKADFQRRINDAQDTIAVIPEKRQRLQLYNELRGKLELLRDIGGGSGGLPLKPGDTFDERNKREKADSRAWHMKYGR
jgi:hypothetical protein